MDTFSPHSDPIDSATTQQPSYSDRSLVTPSQWRDRGEPYWWLRSHGERRRHGAYAVGEPHRLSAPDWADAHWMRTHQAMRALTRVRPDAAAGYATAAILHGLPVPPRLQSETLHVVVATHAPRVRRDGVVGHRTKLTARDRVYGVPVASVEHTLLQCGRILGVRDAVVFIDAIIGTWHSGPLATPEVIGELLQAAHRVPGLDTLREAYALARPRVGSPRETVVRLEIIAAGLPEPEVNGAIDLPGRGTIHPDLVFREPRVVVEYEGSGHRTSREQWAYDLARYDDLEACGWRVIRISAGDRPEDYIPRIVRALNRRQAIDA